MAGARCKLPRKTTLGTPGMTTLGGKLVQDHPNVEWFLKHIGVLAWPKDTVQKENAVKN